MVDHPGTRGFWYYVAFAVDSCGNLSPVSNRTRGALDYHLGDVSDGATPGHGDNRVAGEDVSLLGANYGITEPAITTRGVGYLDVGPTTDSLATSRPVTDDRIDFEDLMMFSLNYQVVSGPALAAHRAAAREARGPGLAGAPDRFRLVAPAWAEAGTTVPAELRLEAGGQMQGFSVRLAWDATVVEPLGMESGSFVESQGGLVLSPAPGTVDAALLGVGAQGMAGFGTVATVRFRALRAGDPGLRIGSVTARDERNHAIGTGEVVSVDLAAAPLATRLLSLSPNPFRSLSTVVFSLARAGPLELAVYSVDGRRVRTLASGRWEAGVHRQEWDGLDDGRRRVAPGVYYVRMVAGSERFTGRLVFLR
jgi:hypothetical protein